MGAPSRVHESRVADLETLATLAAFTAPVRLPWRLRPDVARISRGKRGLFLGDAKATETPGCAATSARLRWYAIGLRSLDIDLARAVVALAVDEGGRVEGWHRTLVEVFGPITGATRTSIVLLDGTAVVSLDLRLPSR